MVVGVLLVVVPAGVLIGLALRAYRVSGALAEQWAGERSLALDDENRPMVSWYLRTSRTLRLLGVLAGFVLTPLAGLALGDRSLGSGYVWFAVVAGYLIGVLYAEVSLRRPRGHGASIRPRRLRDYLSPRALRTQRWTAGGAAVVAAAALVVPMRDPELVSGAERVGILAGVVVVFAVLERTQFWLIRRPQPVVSESLIAADDAIRMQSVHSIAGAGIGLQWLLAGAAMWALAGSDVQILRWTMWVPAMASWIIALAACTRYDRGVWPIQQVAA